MKDIVKEFEDKGEAFGLGIRNSADVSMSEVTPLLSNEV